MSEHSTSIGETQNEFTTNAVEGLKFLTRRLTSSLFGYFNLLVNYYTKDTFYEIMVGQGLGLVADIILNYY